MKQLQEEGLKLGVSQKENEVKKSQKCIDKQTDNKTKIR